MDLRSTREVSLVLDQYCGCVCMMKLGSGVAFALCVFNVNYFNLVCLM